MNHSPTRQRLVSAARRLFADHGFHGASVRAITTRARANLGAITYHFGSKDNLRDAVLDQLFGRMADAVVAAAGAAGRARDRIAGIVHAIFAFFADTPEAPRLMLHLLASGGRAATTPPPAIVAHQRRVLEAIGSVVEAGAAAGEFRPVPPLMIGLTVLSQSVWFAIMRRHFTTVGDIRIDGPGLPEAVERHITEVVTRALAR